MIDSYHAIFNVILVTEFITPLTNFNFLTVSSFTYIAFHFLLHLWHKKPCESTKLSESVAQFFMAPFRDLTSNCVKSMKWSKIQFSSYRSIKWSHIQFPHNKKTPPSSKINEAKWLIVFISLDLSYLSRTIKLGLIQRGCFFGANLAKSAL